MTSALLRLRWVLLALPLYCLSSSLVACASEEDPNAADSSITGPLDTDPGRAGSGGNGYGGYGGYGYRGYGGYGYGGYGGYGYGYGGR